MGIGLHAQIEIAEHGNGHRGCEQAPGGDQNAGEEEFIPPDQAKLRIPTVV